VVVGRIGGAHGVTGAVRVTSFTVPPDNILSYRPWLVGDAERYREVRVVGAREHGQGFVVRLEGVEDRDQAQVLSGRLVAVPREALPEPAADDEYYWEDLLGLEVTEVGGRRLGVVRRLMETGAHDVLVIAGEGGGETLIPFAAPFVLEVDLEQGRLWVDWPGDPV
jgi:16S rRNA processing protein RimM